MNTIAHIFLLKIGLFGCIFFNVFRNVVRFAFPFLPTIYFLFLLRTYKEAQHILPFVLSLKTKYPREDLARNDSHLYGGKLNYKQEHIDVFFFFSFLLRLWEYFSGKDRQDLNRQFVFYIC